VGYSVFWSLIVFTAHVRGLRKKTRSGGGTA